MQIGLLIPLAAPFADARFLQRLAVLAESSSFDSLWVGEHVVLPAEWESIYPHSDSGEFPSAVRHGELDPYTTLTYLAALTDRIRLGACTTLPQRNPVYTAKEIANADWLSNGRVDVGVGVGWVAEEYEALGVEFSGRGARCDAYLEVMHTLWSDEISACSNEFYSLRPSVMYPKTMQKPGAPLHILGDSSRAIARAAKYGDGLFPLDKTPSDMQVIRGQVDRALAEAGRANDPFCLSVSPYTQPYDACTLEEYKVAGVDQVVLCEFVESLAELERTVDRITECVLKPIGKLA